LACAAIKQYTKRTQLQEVCQKERSQLNSLALRAAYLSFLAHPSSLVASFSSCCRKQFAWAWPLPRPTWNHRPIVNHVHTTISCFQSRWPD
jgi:hypothetical protein